MSVFLPKFRESLLPCVLECGCFLRRFICLAFGAISLILCSGLLCAQNIHKKEDFRGLSQFEEEREGYVEGEGCKVASTTPFSYSDDEYARLREVPQREERSLGERVSFSPRAQEGALVASHAEKSFSSAKALAARNASHVLNPGDVIEVNIFREKDLQAKVRVSSKGSVTLHLLGAVSVAGLSIDEAAEKISRLYNEFLVDPQVRLYLLEASSKRFSILGEINKPGSYEIPFQDQMNLLEAIAMAGGKKTSASMSTVKVFRKTRGGEEKVISVDAGSNEAASVTIFPGDVISVPHGKRMFAILGQVKKPGYYEIPYEGDIDVRNVVAMAGGFTNYADLSKIKIIRTIAGQEKIFRININKAQKDAKDAKIKIQPDDVISVERSIF